MNEMTGRFPVATQPVLTPEILASTLQVAGQPGVFLIKGFTRGVKAWPAQGQVKKVYGTLQLGDHRIDFRTEPHNAPVEGEPVILSASLKIQPAKASDRDRWTGSYGLQLLAEKVGVWSPETAAREAVRLDARPELVPLSAFLDRHTAPALTILVSGKAEFDIQEALTEAGAQQRPRIVLAAFDSEAAVIESARQAVADGAKAVALARGGGAGLELVANSPKVAAALIALGVPFYSAQGHGDDIFLLDKHADECFATPSVLGLAVAREEAEATRRRRERAELLEARQRLADLGAAAQRSDEREGEASSKLAEARSIREKTIHADRQGVILNWKGAAWVLGGFLFAMTLAIIVFS